jgi:hypothetical protein
MGAASRPFKSGGGNGVGPNTGAANVMWNLRTAGPVTVPGGTREARLCLFVCLFVPRSPVHSFAPWTDVGVVCCPALHCAASPLFSGSDFGPPLYVAGLQTAGRDPSAARADAKSVADMGGVAAAEVTPANLWQAMRSRRG